jgi:hypothetical protein
MNQKMLAIAALLAAALLAGIFSSPMTAYAGGDDDDNDHDDEEHDGHDEDNGDEDNGNGNGDSSETNTEQKLKQSNVGSGASTNDNCGQNLINSASTLACVGATIGVDGEEEPETPIVRSHED